MFSAACVLAALLAPSPADIELAAADLHAPVGAPALTERSPRMRQAMPAALIASDALDPDIPDEHRWFSPGLSWDGELNLARGLVAQVAACPPLAEGAFCPPRSWFAAEADADLAAAFQWRCRAADYRDRMPWEDWLAARLEAGAIEADAHADALTCRGCRMRDWAGGSWSRPRRVVLREIREALGESEWAGRHFPGWSPPWE